MTVYRLIKATLVNYRLKDLSLKEREDAAKQIEDAQKQRAQRATERSNQVLQKRLGRKLIPRSKPKDTSQKKEKILIEEDDEENSFFQ